VQNRPDASSILAYYPTPKYEWKVEREFSADYRWDYAGVEFMYGLKNSSKLPNGNYDVPTMPPGAAEFSWPKKGSPYPLHYPIREVCYCDKKGVGWRWEVHLDTSEVFRVDGNTELEKRYGIAPVTPSP
jgi:hypothetical protein